MGGGRRERDGLRICLLSYRNNPHSGGQGVYIRNLGRALRDLGHRVDLVCGPPHHALDDGIRRIPLPCLDLYNPADLFRMPTARELADPVNAVEWLGVATMGFPEPFTFGLRAFRLLRRRLGDYDVLHDNQSLSYGLWALSRRIPMVATIHHPVTVDRRYAARAERPLWRKIQQWRWYSFIGMQKRVARCLYPIITVSGFARGDVCREFRIPAANTRVVPNGIDTDLFRPLAGIGREPGRIIATNSADMPLKGLAHLMHAVAEVRRDRRSVRLVVIGTPNAGGAVIRLVHTLGHRGCGGVYRPGQRRGARRPVRARLRGSGALGVRGLRPAGRGGHGVRGAGDQHDGRGAAGGGGRGGRPGPPRGPAGPGSRHPAPARPSALRP